MIMYLRTILLSLFLLATLTSTAAGQTAQAEQLFRDGKELMAAKKFAEACDAFEASQKMDPLTTTLLNLADCREKNGQYATAWGLFLEAERQTRSGDKAAKTLGKTAKARAAKLEPRVSYLIINVPDESRVDGLTITRNGEPVDQLTWNRALPVDGGDYVIEGKAPGHEPWSTRVSVSAEKDKESVDVPKFKTVVAPPIEEPKPPVGGAVPEPDDGEPVDRRGGGGGMSGKRKAAIGIGVVGLVALGAAGYFEFDARGKYDDSENEPDDTRQQQLYDDAVTSRKLAIGAGIAGGVCVGVAAYLWFTGGSTDRDESDAQGVRVLPAAGPDGFGLAIAGGF